jgi:hypothetical protein
MEEGPILAAFEKSTKTKGGFKSGSGQKPKQSGIKGPATTAKQGSGGKKAKQATTPKEGTRDTGSLKDFFQQMVEPSPAPVQLAEASGTSAEGTQSGVSEREEGYHTPEERGVGTQGKNSRNRESTPPRPGFVGEKPAEERSPDKKKHKGTPEERKAVGRTELNTLSASKPRLDERGKETERAAAGGGGGGTGHEVNDPSGC